MTLTSTVPAAVAALQTHMTAVAAGFPDLNPGVYLGEVIGGVAGNFLAIGNPTGDPGDIVLNYQMQRVGTARPGAARFEESYAIGCTLRTWAQTVNPTARLADAFSLITALTVRLGDDPQAGAAPNSVLGSGFWSLNNVTNEHAGRMDGQGWGCEFTFSVDVSDVILTSR